MVDLVGGIITMMADMVVVDGEEEAVVEGMVDEAVEDTEVVVVGVVVVAVVMAVDGKRRLGWGKRVCVHSERRQVSRLYRSQMANKS